MSKFDFTIKGISPKLGNMTLKNDVLCTKVCVYAIPRKNCLIANLAVIFMCFHCLREKRYVFDDLFPKDLLDQGFCVYAFLGKNFLIANAAVIYILCALVF